MMKWRSPAVLPGLILIALLFTGCAATGENTAANQVPVKVYFGAPDAERLVAEKVFLSQDALIMKRSMEILLGGPGNPALFAVVPAEAKVKSVVVKDRIAYVDFSGEMVTRGFGGSSRELLAVGAIVNTLTEFPEVEQVQILIEGKKVSTLFGHMDISEPLGRSPEIITGN